MTFSLLSKLGVDGGFGPCYRYLHTWNSCVNRVPILCFGRPRTRPGGFLLSPTNARQGTTDNPHCMTEAFDVVSHGRNFGVSLGGDDFAPITRAGMPRHRADVAVMDISDLACMGLPGGDYDIRFGVKVNWLNATPIGTCTPAMRAKIVATLFRESEARRLESKYRVSSGFAAVASEASRMAPGTRRVGNAN